MTKEIGDERLYRDQLITALFGAVSSAEFGELKGLFSAFDQYSAASPEAFSELGPDDDDLAQRFQSADELLHFTTQRRQSPLDYALAQVVPTVVLDRYLGQVSANSEFQSVFGDGAAAAERQLFPSSEAAQLHQVFKSTEANPAKLIEAEKDGELVIFFAERIDLWTADRQTPETFLSLKLLEPSVSQLVAELLADKFALTSAELDIIADLVRLKNVDAIAEDRARSVRTVRTQLSQIYNKTGVLGQLELFGLVSTLALLVRAPEWREDKNDETGLELYHIDVGSGRLSYHSFGPRNGRPVLVLNNSFRPSLTAPLRRALADAKLRVLVPIKPGSHETPPRPRSHGGAQLAQDYVDLLDQLKIKRCTVLGIHSAGVNALALAERAPERIDRIVMCDTGVPYENRADIMALPNAIRRTMLPARYTPSILLAPHKIVASVFNRSLDGEQRIVEYFFADSPVDARLCQTDKAYYELTRDTIRYSFEDIERLVGDVARWASDWSDLLVQTCAQHNVVFVHGEENTMFSVTKVSRFAENHNAKVLPVPGEGQLQMFHAPDRVLTALTAPWSQITSLSQ